MKQIKICGIKRREDVEALNLYLPDYCGFIINFPKSHRNVTVEQVQTLSAKLHPKIITVGVFVDQPIKTVVEFLNQNIIQIAQLHGHEDNAYVSRLKTETNHGVWQAFQIHTPDDIKKANDSTADLVLLDAGQGVGISFDWSLLEQVTKPFALAGGLNFTNLYDALSTRAVLLDVSSGVETHKVKDPAKIKSLIEEIRKKR